MTKWEYATVPLLVHATKQILDTWGEDGWELVQVVPGPNNPEQLVAYLKREKTARVSLEVKGLQILDGATRDVKIPTSGEVKLDWRVRAGAPGDVVLTAKSLTDEESDAMELTLPVNPYGVKMSQAKAGTMEQGAAEGPFHGEITAQTPIGSRA